MTSAEKKVVSEVVRDVLIKMKENKHFYFLKSCTIRLGTCIMKAKFIINAQWSNTNAKARMSSKEVKRELCVFSPWWAAGLWGLVLCSRDSSWTGWWLLPAQRGLWGTDAAWTPETGGLITPTIITVNIPEHGLLTFMAVQ